jgi:hypothetical protein
MNNKAMENFVVSILLYNSLLIISLKVKNDIVSEIFDFYLFKHYQIQIQIQNFIVIKQYSL